MADIEEQEAYDSDPWEEEQPLQEARKDAVYDVDGLHDKLGDLGWGAEDDLAREMFFYTQALNGAQEAYDKLQELGVPFLRPDDYYADMVKSDGHMLKVKERLLSDKRRIEEEQERRKAREAKKFAKEVQANKIKERARQKKHDMESIKKWRKMRSDQNFPQGGLDVSNSTKSSRKHNGAAPWDRSGGKTHSGEKSKSRQQRDAKFGYGGRKGLNKKNTSDSTAGPGGRLKKQRHT